MDETQSDRVLFEKNKERESSSFFWFWVFTIGASIVWIPIFLFIYFQNPSSSGIINFSSAKYVLEKTNIEERRSSLDFGEEYFFSNEDLLGEIQGIPSNIVNNQQESIPATPSLNQQPLDGQGTYYYQQPADVQQTDNAQPILRNNPLESVEGSDLTLTNSINQQITHIEPEEYINAEEGGGE